MLKRDAKQVRWILNKLMMLSRRCSLNYLNPLPKFSNLKRYLIKSFYKPEIAVLKLLKLRAIRILKIKLWLLILPAWHITEWRNLFPRLLLETLMKIMSLEPSILLKLLSELRCLKRLLLSWKILNQFSRVLKVTNLCFVKNSRLWISTSNSLKVILRLLWQSSIEMKLNLKSH